MHHQMILWFLLIFTINCGGAAAAAGLGGRQWLGDAATKGTASTMKGDLITAVDPAPYETARISRSQFSYSFRLNPGQKSIRLHFNPSSYDQFESFNDFFRVEAGPYSLLANFSASITARALAVDVIVREFCIITKENETLDLVFSPETSSPWENKNYAFITRIEIISAPSTTVSYCHGGDIGAHVLGQKPLINVDNTTALERVHYRHIKWGSASSHDDIGSMFGMWGSAASSLKKMANNKTWRVSVDVGFKYLVRLHLCDVGLEMDFVLLIDNIIILTSADFRQQREKEQNLLWYNNYMVMVEAAGKEEEKRDISISLHSHHEFLDRHGPLEGFEVFKLSNHDRGLASPSPLLQRRDSQQALLTPLQALLYNPHLYIKHLDYTTLYAIFLTTCMIVTVINLEHKMSVDNSTKEVEKPSAIENFHDGRVLGRGESGKVWKGLKKDFRLMIDNIVALTSADLLRKSDNETLLWYNYMVMVKGKKREGNKHRISISLHSEHELVDRQGPLEGFEVFQLSNLDLSLASPNPPLPPSRGSPPPHYFPMTLLNSLLGRINAIATMVFLMLCLVYISLLQNMCVIDFSEEENEQSAKPKQPCRRFTLAEIQSATENFHSGFFIGKGGFGNVYKGFIDNGREMVAIKRLKPDSNQGEQQFWTEVEMLSELRHEFMPCGTLADHLFKLAQKSRDYIPPSWKQRLKICIGAARALDYLHTGHGIIHRDLKSSNILLDEKFVAKLSDFGLAKPGFCSESQSQKSTIVKGTLGYWDPNYCETHRLTKNSDTYSFGVVLLEVLCGRRALERHSEEDKCHLTTWAIDNISKGQVDQIVFPSLIGEISPDSLKTFVKATKRCLHDEPRKRPAIRRVVMKLESPESNEKTSIGDWFSTTDKYQKEKMNLKVPNEKIDIVDTLRLMENAKSSSENEIRNVTNGMPCADNGRTMPRPMASLISSMMTSREKNMDLFVLTAPLYDEPASRNCFPGKKLNSESVESNLLWQANPLGRFSSVDVLKLKLLIYYRKARELSSRGSLEKLRRDVSVQPLPRDSELKALFRAALAVESNMYWNLKTSNMLPYGTIDSFCSRQRFSFDLNELVIPMCQHRLWEHMVMLLQNVLPQGTGM